MNQETPFLWLLAGPNGAGKTTYHDRVIAPRVRMPFVNADRIARGRWPVHYAAHAYEAAQMAAATRDKLIAARKSFVAETVFSHPSKLELIRRATDTGYVVWLTFVNVAAPELAVARVGQRQREGGHPVPSDKVRGRYARLLANMAAAMPLVARFNAVDNSEAGRALRDVLLVEQGCELWRAPDAPVWVDELLQ